jgi:hypothetical protein
VFDYRLLHAGRANHSAADRPVLYYVYAKPWFVDPHNFPDRSVWASTGPPP